MEIAINIGTDFRDIFPSDSSVKDTEVHLVNQGKEQRFLPSDSTVKEQKVSLPSYSLVKEQEVHSDNQARKQVLLYIPNSIAIDIVIEISINIILTMDIAINIGTDFRTVSLQTHQSRRV
eukprot:500056-Ditylum_brightwellii.AAC.1